jgi:protein-disulfide isomerase
MRKQSTPFLIVAVLLATASLACATLTGGVSGTQPIGTFTTVPTQTWPQADGKALGPKTAKVLVQEFGDFQCPFCAEFFHSVEPQIMRDFVISGTIRYEFHHFIVIDSNTGGNESHRAAEASECANEQGRFWDYHNMLYSNQQGEGSGAFADRRLKAFAAALGLDAQKFNTCFDSGRYVNAVNADNALGTQMGVKGTPTLFINGVAVNNALDYNEVKQKIQALVAAQ